METSFYDSENPQDYIYDSEATNDWYWKENQNETMLQKQKAFVVQL